jgi:hypothetical protein
MLRRVEAKVSEFLVVARAGRLRSLGVGASAILWPGSTHVTVSAARQEATFELTQETRDGIPLRMKGIVVYRVVDPVLVATRFDFSSGDGHARIQTLLAHVSLGELRAAATAMTMQECIERRKTTLTEAVARALEVATAAPGDPWGIAVDVVQVAQVFIVDADLRRKLEAQVRSRLAAQSELAELRKKDEVAAAEADARRLALERAGQLAELELDAARRAATLRAAEVETMLIEERARQALRLEALPVEQVPAIADALGRAYQGAQLSFYGEGAVAASLAGVAPLVELVASRLRGERRPERE